MILDAVGFWRFLRNGLTVLVLAVACLAPSSRTLAQDDIGVDAGTNCLQVGSAIVLAIGEASGLPGETASVPFNISNTDDNDVASFQMDFFFPVDKLTLATGACTIDQRLPNYGISLFINPSTCQPPTGFNCARVAVANPNIGAMISDGNVFNCQFGVMAGLALNTVLPVDADASSLIISNGSTHPQCLEPTDATDGSVTVQEPFTPTPTPSATVTRTATPIGPTPTNTGGGGTATPTRTGGGGTATPTITPGGATNTPTRTGGGGTATPTITPGGATNTPGGATPTRTRTGGVGPTATSPPSVPFPNDDCSIAPPGHSNPWHSLVLLIVPAILLAGRRRR